MEVDETVAFRESGGVEDRPGMGRSAKGRILLAGTHSLRGFMGDAVEPGAQVITDG